jgi:hypothetical protein
VAGQVVVNPADPDADAALVVVGVVVGSVVRPVPPDLDRVPTAVVIRAVVDAAHTGQGDSPFEGFELQPAPTAFLA